ncbi:MAG: efflux RND transporter permease subunit [Spirochaetaceae bacterium]|nr:efflux RND transporter permease subunit [Spirochaetaceae bacterium]
MSLMRSVLDKPTTVLIIGSLLLALSLFMLTLIPQQFFPDIEFPTVTVSTAFPGASPEEVENSISRLLEGTLLGISGIENISSTSNEGSSAVSLNFSFGTNLDAAVNDIRDRLDMIRNQLPDGASSPMIFRMDINSFMPVMYMTLSAPGLLPDDLTYFADDVVRPLLEQIDGVSRVDAFGGREEQVRINVLQNRLDAYNITMNDINMAIAAQNLQMGAGAISDGDRRLLLRTDGTFNTVEDIQNVVVSYRPVNMGQGVVPVLLRDIADVYLGYEDIQVVSELNGGGAFTIMVYRASDANIVQVANRINRDLPDINNRLPEGMELTILFDSSTMVTQSLSQVVWNVLLGALFSVIVLIFFLRSMKSAFIIALTMPFSVLVTIMFMYYFNLSINIMSLAGLNLGIGMVTDSGIVILENITRYREKGVSAKTSAILGSQEMITAIMASTLTTVCVFLPMVIFAREIGIAGVIFNDLSFTVVISLVSSLVIAMTLIPVLAGVYMPVRTSKQRELSGIMRSIDKIMNRLLTWLDNKYSNGIVFSLKYRKTVLFTIFMSLVLALGLLGSGLVAFEFMPGDDGDSFMLTYTLPEGTLANQTNQFGLEFTAMLAEEIGVGVEHFMLISGINLGGVSGREQQNIGYIMFFLPPFNERTMTGAQLGALVRDKYDLFPGIDFQFSSLMGGGMGGGATISVDIASNDQLALMQTAARLVEIFEEVPQLSEPRSSLDDGLPQIELHINRERAYSMGLNIATIAREVSANISGTTVGRFSSAGRDINIVSQLAAEDRATLSDLDRIFVVSPVTGAKVAISNVATVERGFSPTAIFRYDQTRQISVSAVPAVNSATGREFAEGEANNAAWAAINESLQDGRLILPEGVRLSQAGGMQQFAELAPRLMGILLVSILLVYGVMASQFESLKDPFIIILSITTLPLGPVLIYLLTGTPFSMFSIVGFVMLSGICVNNGIILVDYTNLLRRRGMPLYEAIVEAGRSRLRPIMMTAGTTILAMLPMALSQAEGSAMTRVIGVTVVGGMVTSSLMTLFLVPTLYYNFNRKGEKKMIKAAEKREEELFGKNLATQA